MRLSAKRDSCGELHAALGLASDSALEFCCCGGAKEQTMKVRETLLLKTIQSIRIQVQIKVQIQIQIRIQVQIQIQIQSNTKKINQNNQKYQKKLSIFIQDERANVVASQLRRLPLQQPQLFLARQPLFWKQPLFQLQNTIKFSIHVHNHNTT